MKRTTPIPSKLNASQQQSIMLRQAVAKMLSSSILTSRASLASSAGQSFDGKRDIYTALGYPKTITFQQYYDKYRRQDIAGRLVDAPVDGAWEQKPKILEPNTKDTQFEKDWKELVDKFKIWNIITRVDKLSRIGEYAILFLGFDDIETTDDLRNEVQGTPELQYLQPYKQDNAEITEWVKDAGDPRYGMPLIYRLTIEKSGAIEGTSQISVHHSRIIHMAEGLLESNIYGLPALERVYNRLLNIELIIGGSAEMFWQGAFPGYAFVAADDADMTQTASAIEDEIDMFVHDFKRYMKLQGLEVTKLTSDVASPKDHLESQLTMISVASGIPTRVLTGSERGELASSQDEAHWNNKLDSRRVDHCEPNILRALIDRLIKYKILAAPGADGYKVEWPDLNSPTDKDKADVAKTLSGALKDYMTNPETEMLLPFESYLEEILQLPPEAVTRIIEARDKQETTTTRNDVVDENNLEV
ncbi:MAG: DUF1073 domain-containing protein [Desulfobulbaceae bacterium]|nr:DUF1073 domain-containing protein [Desulfobulbaceae bacterium]